MFRVKNFDITKELKDLFPDLESDPNDCYFEDISIENERHKHNEKKFFHIIDMRLRLNVNNDNRFSYFAPIVTNVTPHQGISNGGQQIEITGMNFGLQTSNIKEILIIQIETIKCNEQVWWMKSRESLEINDN